MVTIRKAAADDMGAVMGVVNRVFWGEQNIPLELHPIPEGKRPQWWCAEHEGQIVATASLFREDGVWHMGRICVSPRLRGRQIATKLLRFALTDIFSQGIGEVYLEARDATVHIMKKFGAEVIAEPVFFYGSNITLTLLKKDAFLRSING